MSICLDDEKEKKKNGTTERDRENVKWIGTSTSFEAALSGRFDPFNTKRIALNISIV